VRLWPAGIDTYAVYLLPVTIGPAQQRTHNRTFAALAASHRTVACTAV
jgi:hypothetical protein